MKKLFTKAGWLAVAAVAITACGDGSASAVTGLTPEGLGCLKKGAPVASIPDECDGVYDKVAKTTEEDMGDTYTQYVFYAGERKVAEIPAYGENIDLLIVYAPGISTPDGVHPGMKVADLLAKPGVKALYQDGLEYELNGFRFRVDGLNEAGLQKMNDAYAKGAELVLEASDFEPDAMVESIYYVGD